MRFYHKYIVRNDNGSMVRLLLKIYRPFEISFGEFRKITFRKFYSVTGKTVVSSRRSIEITILDLYTMMYNMDFRFLIESQHKPAALSKRSGNMTSRTVEEYIVRTIVFVYNNN